MPNDTVSGLPVPAMTPTERNRLYRRRRRARAMVITVGVTPSVVRGLRALGLLSGDAFSPRPAPAEVAAAVEKLIEAAAPLSSVAAALYPGEVS
jgi:hypothetical protein